MVPGGVLSAGPIRASYDRVAAEYAARVGGELAGKPADRALLAGLAARAAGRGPVGDLGCGPAHVAGHLAALGVPAVGVDLTGWMERAGLRVEEVLERDAYPGVEVETRRAYVRAVRP